MDHSSIDRGMLDKHWIHSHEEDMGDRIVYRLSPERIPLPALARTHRL